ncbi:hypothetical protein L218DRAFT_862975, partial [Marasmius fiardii PR-910]
HRWYFNKDDEVPIENQMCEQLGLPTTLWVRFGSSNQYSWPTKTYKLIHNWQVARGFDPTTAEFTKYCWFPVFDVTDPGPGRFEAVD